MFLSSVCGITPEWAESRGLRGLILDLDNTLAFYLAPVAPPDIEAWIADMAASGVKLAVCSNSREKRVSLFCDRLGLTYVHTARKPKKDGLLKAAELMGLEPGETAMVGDQLFTDVLAGRRAGMTTVLVDPLKNNIVFRLRRRCERLFMR
ncbi:MAG: YqeG family HAD IIIA-type phosphatase [Oscillospiraceae bacterium]|nr:YqeG family HAD IIIA-type phosphatase [Oscillospiraceae bacterium]